METAKRVKLARIDAGLSVLRIEEETSIIERYISLIKGKFSPGVS